jgi:hypothetical protein
MASYGVRGLLCHVTQEISMLQLRTMLHLLAMIGCAAVVAISKVGLVKERKVLDELERKLTARKATVSNLN